MPASPSLPYVLGVITLPCLVVVATGDSAAQHSASRHCVKDDEVAFMQTKLSLRTSRGNIAEDEIYIGQGFVYEGVPSNVKSTITTDALKAPHVDAIRLFKNFTLSYRFLPAGNLSSHLHPFLTNASVPFRCGPFHNTQPFLFNVPCEEKDCVNLCSPDNLQAYRKLWMSLGGGGWTLPSGFCLTLECLLLVSVILCYYLRQHILEIQVKCKQPPPIDTEALYVDTLEPRLLHHRFVQLAEKTPEAVAIIDEGSRLTYGEVQQAALRVVSLLVQMRGVEPCSRTPVGICADGTLFVIGVMGIVQTGNPYVPFLTQPPLTQVEFILQDANIDTVLVDSELLLHSGPWDGRKEVQPFTLALQNEPGDIWWTVRESDLAYILYTSGSTGKPKGVLAPHRCYASRLIWMWQRLAFIPGEIGVQKTAPIWVDHIQEIFGYLGGGAAVVIAPESARKDPDALALLCQRHEVTRMVLVPSLLRAIVSRCGGSLSQAFPRLRCVISSGEPLSVDLLKVFLANAAACTTLVNTYGSTEVAGDVTWAHFTARSKMPEGDLVPIGKPMPGVHIHILNPDTLCPVEDGTTGELFVEGDFVAEGYLNCNEEQNLHFLKPPSLKADRVFRTGDFGRMDGGLIYFHGRRDQQVKVHGQRIEVLHVETVLKNAVLACSSADGETKIQLPAAVVIPILSKVNPGSYELHAFLEAGSMNVPAIKEHMLKSLLAAHVPVAFWIESSLPRLPNSKLDRTALQVLAQDKVKIQQLSEDSVSQTDSFGQTRHVAQKYAHTQRALGNMATYITFKIVFHHWTEEWYIIGTLPNSPSWLLSIVAEWTVSDDVGLLMLAIGFMHGLGGEERFKPTMLEPTILALYLFWRFMLGPVLIEYGSIAALGYSTRSLLTYDPEVPSYFLALLFAARIIVIVCHTFGISKTATSQLVITGVVLSVCFLISGPLSEDLCSEQLWCQVLQVQLLAIQSLFVPIYLGGLYFGRTIVDRLQPWKPYNMHGLIGCGSLCYHVVGSCILNHTGLSSILSLALWLPIAIALLLFFITLPAWVNFQLPGATLLAVNMLNLEVGVCVVVGLKIYGLQVLPSYIDLVLAAGELPHLFFPNMPTSHLIMALMSGSLQLVALTLPIVCFMILMSRLVEIGSTSLRAMTQTLLTRQDKV